MVGCSDPSDGCGVVVFSLYIHTDTLIQSHMSMTRPAPSKMGVDRSHLGGGQTDLENLVLFLALVLVVIAMIAQWGRIHPINTVRCWREESDQLGPAPSPQCQ